MIFWDVIESPFSHFAAWVDRAGRLVRFRLHATGAAQVDSQAVRDAKALCEVRRQVDEYSRGERKQFELELGADGPDFEKRVWTALLDIPFGTTTSYGAVAKAIGEPQSARAVGAANGANPIALIVPCHRVIGADGSLTGYGGGLPLKRKLLAHEAKVSGFRFDLFE
jgi:methylated-DNA-[protein]-cysteine S-methyltransferase